jgi:phospholipid/cholesterol/gamma-HCH transport system substrate-binding protein
MKIRLNPLLLGAFITGAVVIAIAALLGLGPISLFHPVGRFVFYLPRSVEGVGEGTAVSLDGVRVGQVERVRVFYDRAARRSFVSVICRINKNLLTDLQGRPIKLTDRQTLRNLVSEGLFAQVQTTGLVGAQYVELGFNPAAPPIDLASLPASPYPVVPTVPSTMSEVTANISSILSNLRQIDYHGLMQQVNGVLVSARGQLGELETNRLTDHVSAAAQSFGHFMNSSDLRGAVARLQEAAANFQNLATNLNAQVRPAAASLDATLASARQSAQALQNFLTLRNQLGEQTQELLEQLNQTARAIEQLSDFLERHPNALITGRAEPTGLH